MFFAALEALISVYFWIDFFYGFTAPRNPNASLIMAVIMMSLSALELFPLWPKNRLTNIAAFILALPLMPFFIVGILSQTRLLASLTLPMMVLGLLIPVSTILFQQLELLRLGEKFNSLVIPYLNLTTITVVFAYSDKYLTKLMARVIPDNQMPQAVKDATFELLEKRPFVKVAYLVLTILFVIVTIEKLSEREFLPFPNYKSIVLESLLTFIAIDRLVTKWQKA